MSTHSVSFNLNKVEQAGTTVSAKLHVLSSELKHQVASLRALHSFQDAEGEVSLIVNVSLDINNEQAAQIRDDLSNLLQMLPIPFPTSVVTEGNKVHLGVKMPNLYNLPID